MYDLLARKYCGLDLAPHDFRFSASLSRALGGARHHQTCRCAVIWHWQSVQCIVQISSPQNDALKNPNRGANTLQLCITLTLLLLAIAFPENVVFFWGKCAWYCRLAGYRSRWTFQLQTFCEAHWDKVVELRVLGLRFNYTGFGIESLGFRGCVGFRVDIMI